MRDEIELSWRTPEAQEQVVALYNYIATAASPDIARQCTESIMDDQRVSVLGVFHGGQDYETLLHSDPEG